MKYLLLLCSVSLLVSCQRSAISKKLAGCDSLVITFNTPGTDSVIAETHTTDTRAIQQLARFLNGNNVEPGICRYDGNMLFFKGGRQVLPVIFSFREGGCRRFLFDLDNKVISSTLSNEAADFLQSLLDGKDWY